MGRDGKKRGRSLTIERAFEPSRLGGEAMATSYVRVVPVGTAAVRRVKHGWSRGGHEVDSTTELAERSEAHAG